MRKILDMLYTICGALAAIFIGLICIVVCTQVLFNIMSKLGLFGLNLTIPSYADFSGFFLAASSFFGLAYTLQKGGHIRVTLLLGAVNKKIRFVFEVFTLALCSGFAAYLTFYVGKLLHESWSYGDVSSGIIAIPLYIPQIAIFLGLLIFTISLLDLFVQTIIAKKTVLKNIELE